MCLTTAIRTVRGRCHPLLCFVGVLLLFSGHMRVIGILVSSSHLAATIEFVPKVMYANLLLFKTVIAGDSWGEIAVPVIQAPGTGQGGKKRNSSQSTNR